MVERKTPKFRIVEEEEERTLSQHFSELASLIKIVKDTGYEHKSKTFTLAAQKSNDITTIKQVKNLKGIKGLGEKTLVEAKEFFEKDVTDRLKELRKKSGSLPGSSAKEAKVEKLFQTIHGIGEKADKKLYAKGYRKLADIKSKDLTDAQKVGLKYRDDFLERIPRAELDKYVKKLTKALKSVGNHWILAGSYRRGLATSGDIDILMRNDTDISLAEIVAILKDADLIVDELVLGSVKFMGAIRLAEGKKVRRVDIRLFKPTSWSFALLYNTGSVNFNKLMRIKAISLGYQLNEYNLIEESTGVAIDDNFETEEDVFIKLGLQYLEPEERVDDITEIPSFTNKFVRERS